MIEKEERFAINNSTLELIYKNTTAYKTKQSTLDISFYKDGKNLLDLFGYIIRIRQKGEKISLEIKNYKNKNECQEEAISIPSIKQGVDFIRLLNLEPGIYLKRDREVRKYKNLLIFIDQFDCIGDYVEIEYQDSDNAEIELTEFKKLCNISGEQAPMYGTIINQKIENDSIFKENYYKNMQKILETI